mgnify:CR=1 FL=1
MDDKKYRIQCLYRHWRRKPEDVQARMKSYIYADDLQHILDIAKAMRERGHKVLAVEEQQGLGNWVPLKRGC